MRSTGLLAAVAVVAIGCLGCGPKPAEPAPRTSMGLSQTTPAGPAAEVAEADRLYEQGMGFYLKGRPGSPDSNANLQQAAKRFRSALQIYERAAKADPKNQKLQSRIQECNSRIYACAKMQTL